MTIFPWVALIALTILWLMILRRLFELFSPRFALPIFVLSIAVGFELGGIETLVRGAT